MNELTKKIAYTAVPYLSGYIFAYLVMAFVMWNRDPNGWAVWDRAFCFVLGWVVGSMLYVRFTWNNK